MRRDMNVIIIIIDCLRRDYSKELQDKAKKKGFIIYNNVIAPAPWTVPSVVSILTGLYPTAHGVHETSNRKIPYIRVPRKVSKLFLNRLLSSAGFLTYLLSANPLITPEFGFKYFDYTYIVDPNPPSKPSIGKLLRVLAGRSKLFVQNSKSKLGAKFAQYTQYIVSKKLRELTRSREDKGASILLKIAKEILKHTKKPVFLYIHLMEPHEPYSTLSSKELFIWQYVNIVTGIINPELVLKLREGYVRSVKYITRKVIEFVNFLEEEGILYKSLVVISSDHGQLLGEHNRLMHGIYLYDELLRVPLIIKYPEHLNIHHSNNYGFISLVKLRKLIYAALTCRIESDELLYEDSVFSESYGIHHDLEVFARQHNVPESIIRAVNSYGRLNTIEKHRIAVYTRYYKAVYNVNDRRCEEILLHEKSLPKAVEEHTIEHKILKFLRTCIAERVKMTIVC